VIISCPVQAITQRRRRAIVSETRFRWTLWARGRTRSPTALNCAPSAAAPTL